MKRFIPLILILVFFSGCKVKEYTPVIPETFTQNVMVYTGDFSFTCEICKTQKNVSALITSTNAKGMRMTFDGSELLFSYNDFSYTLDGNKFEKDNVAVVIYEVFSCLGNMADVNARKLDDGYRYDGKISVGDFTLIQNEDNSFKSIEIKECDYKIIFN